MVKDIHSGGDHCCHALHRADAGEADPHHRESPVGWWEKDVLFRQDRTAQAQPRQVRTGPVSRWMNPARG